MHVAVLFAFLYLITHFTGACVSPGVLLSNFLRDYCKTESINTVYKLCGVPGMITYLIGAYLIQVPATI